MAYRAELETRRAEVTRLERELEELRREIALLERLPSTRGIGTTLLGAPKTIVHERVLAIELARLRPEVVAAALAREIGAAGRSTRPEGGAIVWRAEPEPRGRVVEVRLEADGDRVRVRVEDTHATARAMMTATAGTSMLVAQALMQRTWWFAAIAVLLALTVPVLHRGSNRRVGRRRERQAIASLDALAAVALEVSRAVVRARVGSDDAEDGDAIEGAADAARARSA